jgi:hypothetical protein
MKYFGTAVRNSIPQPEVDWSSVEKVYGSSFMGAIVKSAYDNYIENGGSLTAREAIDRYRFYADEEWEEATAYWGNEPYGCDWKPTESFSRWLNVELKGGKHSRF